jgi:hypothetical protein
VYACLLRRDSSPSSSRTRVAAVPVIRQRLDFAEHLGRYPGVKVNALASCLVRINPLGTIMQYWPCLGHREGPEFSFRLFYYRHSGILDRIPHSSIIGGRRSAFDDIKHWQSQSGHPSSTTAAIPVTYQQSITFVQLSRPGQPANTFTNVSIHHT